MPDVTRVLRTGDLELRVRSSIGSPQAPVFVLVHGLGLSHRSYARLQRELRRSGTTHCIDLPGFGATPVPKSRMSIEAAASLLADALDELGIADAVLVGHSMGVQVVTELAVQRPDLVTHLVLIGPVTDPRRAGRVPQAVDLARDALTEPPGSNALTIAEYLRCGPRWYLTELESMLGYRTEQRLRLADAHTLVVRGSGDPVARRPWCDDLAAAARDGYVVEISGHRHLVQHTAAERTASAIVEFSRQDVALER